MRDQHGILICDDCAAPLTPEEWHWYGDHKRDSGRCELCERAWSDRMTAWRKGGTIEPELDAMFSGKLR